MLLVGIKSCWRDRDAGFHNAIRGTWGNALRQRGVLVRFFLGHDGNPIDKHPKSRSEALQSDEITIDSADDYHSLPFKTRAICHWTYPKNVDHIFLCDTDTYVKADKLLACGYQRYDYVGKISKPIGVSFPYVAVGRNGVMEPIDNCYPWASGGFGYFLSRNAFGLVADSYPTSWAEDLWVGQLLAKGLAKEEFTALDLPAGSYSMHFPSAQYNSGYDLKFGWMDQMHKEHGK
jgi:hypothetical protein